MNRHELEQWLGERESRSVELNELAEVLHVIMEASPRAVAFKDAEQLRELRFAIAVLRDVFPRDDDVRNWLLAPLRGIGGGAPADFLAAGRVREFADLAVDEWNRPRAPFVLRARTALARV